LSHIIICQKQKNLFEICPTIFNIFINLTGLFFYEIDFEKLGYEHILTPRLNSSWAFF